MIFGDFKASDLQWLDEEMKLAGERYKAERERLIFQSEEMTRQAFSIADRIRVAGKVREQIALERERRDQ